ncbi:MAG: hypothetical protein EHV01_005400 [Spiroplasma sp. hy2]
MLWIHGSTSIKKVFQKYLHLAAPQESTGKTLDFLHNLVILKFL